MKPIQLMLVVLSFYAAAANAQFRPPAFAGGIPGIAQMQAIWMQRHQARTLLYREALEELRKNPAAADVPECPSGAVPSGTLCLKQPDPAVPKPVAATPAPEPLAAVPPAAIPPTVAKPVPPVAPTEAVAVAKPMPSPAVPAASAPAAAQVPEAPSKPAAPAPGRRLALLFGNNDYPAPIPALDTPVADVQKIAAVLQSRFGYEPTVIKNAGKGQIIAALNKMAGDAQAGDSVLLFYAGHGYLMEDIKMGFWIPVDASVKTAAGWISNNDISKLLAAIPSRQLILVSDSCFSGTLTKEQKVSAARGKPEDVLQRRSVIAFSSGGDEPVSDEGKEGHSIFAWNLIKALESAGGMTFGQDIYNVVRGKVKQEYPQDPQYGAVVSAGHAEGGEYLFQPR